MVLEDIPAPLALLFGGYILGAGYLALLSYFKDDYSKLDSFDKFMISLTFGVFSFIITASMLNIRLDFMDTQSINEFFKAFPLVFIINVFVARLLMEAWKYIQNNILNRKEDINT